MSDVSRSGPVVLFTAVSERWEQYRDPIEAALAEAGLTDAMLTREAPPETVDYMVFAPNGSVSDFRPYTRLKAVLNLWAGVEDVVHNETLDVPLARMVDTGLTEGMIAWVTGHVLRHHLLMDEQIHGLDGRWKIAAPPLMRDRSVGILGLGELGSACAEVLVHLGFRVSGWSRSQKNVPGVACHSGEDGLRACLEASEFVVLLLPATPATENTLDAAAIAAMPRGGVVLNPGRGTLIDDDALLTALDSGHLSHATLDTFREEPLPEGHVFWSHPKVTVTPHVASITRPETASRVIAENIRRGEAGEPFLHLVDRGLGY